MSSIRVFIAVTLDEEIRNELLKIQEALKEKIMGEVRWVRPEAMHLTLKFLGSIEAKALSDIFCATLKTTYREPFMISFSKIGVFPDILSPRVIWMGIEEGRRELEAIANDLDTELFKIGYPKEKRRFTPHLTFARIKSMVNREGFDRILINDYRVNKGMNVRKIEVIKSDLYPEGAVYTTLKEFHFKL